jgi:hypothetical protein
MPSRRSLGAVPMVAFITTCAECGRKWLPIDVERWRAYHVGDDLDEPAELVFYCPECAERELTTTELDAD